MQYFPLIKQEKSDGALIVPSLNEFITSEQGLVKGTRKSPWKRITFWLAWSLLLFGGSRPTWVGDPILPPISGRDMILAVDISGSMGTQDLGLNGQLTTRLSVVKKVVNSFLSEREGDRVGLILFGSQAYLYTPLTFDLGTVKTFLNDAPIGIAGGKTALGDAIGLATKHLASRTKGERVIILLTDGANNSGDISPLKAAQLASKAEIRIHTIGVGSKKSQFPGFFGSQLINPSPDLDEKTLAEISRLTGGQYYRAENTEKLIEVYRIIDSIETIEIIGNPLRPTIALFYWPLSIAWTLMLLLVGIQLIRKTRYD